MDTFDFQEFVAALDSAQKAHFEWSRRILRCAVLHTRPAEDVMQSKAHQHCQFGQFLTAHQVAFKTINPERAEQLCSAHKQMHDAIRHIAEPISHGVPGNADDLDEFEAKQAELLDHLAYFKTRAIHHYTQIDNLTGLPLRQRLAQDYEAKQHCDGGVALLFMDVDHFKAINDFYGHNAGDSVLQHLVMHSHKQLSTNQFMYRYGGEEFVVMVCDQDQPYDAMALAEQLRQSLHGAPMSLENGDSIHVSVTIGVALAEANEPLSQLIGRADQAMYLGKKQGRNRVIHASHCAPTE